jgi:hypothetical protein
MRACEAQHFDLVKWVPFYNVFSGYKISQWPCHGEKLINTSLK